MLCQEISWNEGKIEFYPILRLPANRFVRFCFAEIVLTFTHSLNRGVFSNGREFCSIKSTTDTICKVIHTFKVDLGCLKKNEKSVIHC